MADQSDEEGTRTERIVARLRGLPGIGEELAAWYSGGKRTLADPKNPDGLAQAAVSLRDVLDKIPRAVGLGAPSLRQLDRDHWEVRNRLDQARNRSGAYVAGAWVGTINTMVASLLEAVEGLDRTLAERSKPHQERRRQAAAVITGLPAETADLQTLLLQWRDSWNYFNKVAHHASTERHDFEQRVDEMDAMLELLLQAPAFPEFDTLDSIIARGEGHAH